jgi:hypothetical protein
MRMEAYWHETGRLVVVLAVRWYFGSSQNRDLLVWCELNLSSHSYRRIGTESWAACSFCFEKVVNEKENVSSMVGRGPIVVVEPIFRCLLGSTHFSRWQFAGIIKCSLSRQNVYESCRNFADPRSWGSIWDRNGRLKAWNRSAGHRIGHAVIFWELENGVLLVRAQPIKSFTSTNTNWTITMSW